MKIKVASLPQKVIQYVQIKKRKFHDQQSMCLYGRYRRHDIYMFTGYLYCPLNRYITQILIYSALRIHFKKVLAKTCLFNFDSDRPWKIARKP